MRITIFCGASTGENPVYSEKTVALAQWMAQNKHSLVYGGGKVGLMGVMADTVIANGGYTTGVIPTFLRDREIAHENLSELIIVNNMPERKAKMMLLGDEMPLSLYLVDLVPLKKFPKLSLGLASVKMIILAFYIMLMATLMI